MPPLRAVKSRRTPQSHRGIGDPFNQDPGHWFYNISFTGQLRAENACAQFVQCRLASLFGLDMLLLRFGMLSNAFRLGIGTDTASDRMFGAGCALTSGFTSFHDAAFVWGVLSWAGSGFQPGGSGGSTVLTWAGGSADVASTFAYPGTFLFAWGGAATDNRAVNATVNAERGAQVSLGAGWTFAVTAGSCLRAKMGGQLTRWPLA